MTTIEEIYRAYSNDVYRFACWLCGNTTEAEDIVSETFLRLWGSLEDLQVGTVKASVLTIARNVFISRRRRNARERQLPDELLDHSLTPDVTAEQKDDLRTLFDAMQMLPDLERAAFLLRFQQELPYDEIARMLGARLLHESPEKALNGGTLPPLRREQELEVLRRTKRLIWVRDALFWIAVFLSATPFTVWDTSWGSGWLIRDLPWLACALAVGAAIVWCSYIAMKRRLSVTGL